MPERANCGSCGAPVLWVRSAATSALMALNAEPVAGGDIALVEGLSHQIRGDLFETMFPPAPRYRQHAETCPALAKHRQRVEKKTPSKKGK